MQGHGTPTVAAICGRCAGMAVFGHTNLTAVVGHVVGCDHPAKRPSATDNTQAKRVGLRQTDQQRTAMVESFARAR